MSPREIPITYQWGLLKFSRYGSIRPLNVKPRVKSLGIAIFLNFTPPPFRNKPLIHSSLNVS